MTDIIPKLLDCNSCFFFHNVTGCWGDDIEFEQDGACKEYREDKSP